ncbi:MAG: glycoside hydrolase family 97 N-terminal domain-containing protein, partial [Thermoguttaceae bacterium]|nr:glycoside hydrolase family 97 N-terminal domain-containing protein [Thermoguttaceae bacterium]
MVRSCYRAALVVFAAFVLVCPALASDSVSVVSPNGTVAVSVTVGPDARYSLTYGGTAVLKSSKLGLTFRGAEPFGALKLIGSSTREIDETWRLTCGRKSVYADRCVETALDLQEENAPGRKLRVIVRAYDGGAALRYAIPEDAGVFDAQNEFCVESEETEFAFEKDCDVWAAFFNGFASNHEGNFQKKKLSDIK